MKLFPCSAVLLTVSLMSASALAQCPSAGSATGCDSLISINPGGSLTISAVAGSLPYDGSDDNLVGVTNNSGMTIASFSLTGTGNGGGIFGFDGDGIDSYAPGSNSTDTTGYGGPLAYFTNISVDQATGTVNFINGGLASGASTYFSLESAIGGATITPGPGTPGTAVTPEPSSLLLLGTGALGVAAQLRRRLFV